MIANTTAGCLNARYNAKASETCGPGSNRTPVGRRYDSRRIWQTHGHNLTPRGWLQACMAELRKPARDATLGPLPIWPARPRYGWRERFLVGMGPLRRSVDDPRPWPTGSDRVISPRSLVPEFQPHAGGIRTREHVRFHVRRNEGRASR